MRSNNLAQIFRDSVSLLSARDQRRLMLISITQIIMGLLDLLGVALLGLVGTLTISGIQSSQPSPQINSYLQLIRLDSFEFQEQVAILGLSAALILIGRTLFSIYITRRTLHFFSQKSAKLSSLLIDKLLKQNLTYISKRTSQETIYSLTTGTNALLMGVMATAVTLIGDIALVVILGIGLFVIDIAVALSSLALFSILLLIMHFLLSVRSRRLGEKDAKLSVESNLALEEAILSFRELFVHGKLDSYATNFSGKRKEYAHTQAEMIFLPNISKYVIESGLIFGGLIIAGIQFSLHDASRAFATLSVFLAAGSRLAPAVLRIQQSSLQIRNNSGVASGTLAFIRDLEIWKSFDVHEEKATNQKKTFSPVIQVKSINFAYPETKDLTIKNLSISIPSGSHLGIVGVSGSGKSTLVDLLLGVIEPQTGNILISAETPRKAIEMFPGLISYVPQEVFISSTSIANNVALGFKESEISIERVEALLSMCGLQEDFKSLKLSLDSQIGGNNRQLSGGQRQKLGLARALYTNPKILVLDEFSSALDAASERELTNLIKSLGDGITIVQIAHRLSSVKDCDQLIYLESGEIRASGTFDELRSQVGEFNAQAQLMGY
jgi:ABC-type multidrug transport system fused ATPase/permease subunit